MDAKPKKVLIFSKGFGELSTELVMDWVVKFGGIPTRFNGDVLEDPDSSITISLSENSVFINDLEISSFESAWFRRWSDYSILGKITHRSKNSDPLMIREVLGCVSQDIGMLKSWIISQVRSKKVITSPNQIYANKLSNLVTAKKVGLNIPDFILSTRKDKVLEFFNKYKKILIKDIDFPFSYATENKAYHSFTVLLDENDITSFPEQFYLTFFQQYIVKEIEIRCFVLNNSFYSMAIFSQKNEATKIDFRRGSDEQSRMVPFKLPLYVEKKLLAFMQEIGLNTGSIDLIKTDNEEFYFLEINPVGQFDMVSNACNYQLEKEIAKYLLS